MRRDSRQPVRMRRAVRTNNEAARALLTPPQAFYASPTLSARAMARLELEKKTGLSALSPLNAANAGALDVEEQGLLPPGKER